MGTSVAGLVGLATGAAFTPVADSGLTIAAMLPDSGLTWRIVSIVHDSIIVEVDDTTISGPDVMNIWAAVEKEVGGTCNIGIQPEMPVVNGKGHIWFSNLDAVGEYGTVEGGSNGNAHKG